MAPWKECARILLGMILHPRGDYERASLMIQEVAILGPDLLGELANYGLGIVILRRGERRHQLDLPPGRELSRFMNNPRWGPYADGMRASYARKQRVVVLGEERVKDATMHEFAHALDDALTERDDLSERLSSLLWRKFEPTRKGFVSNYASSEPSEYFAESLSAFFNAGKRERLRACDPGLFAFLDRLCPVPQ